ncbi:YciI family protein [Granulicella arctica]|uniref:YciI family protein n=1 Tax=Granulicella arctica TaxID=940613 RepID=UPI0021E0D02C|nr:YciI family protein [Granulicella arctica]
MKIAAIIEYIQDKKKIKATLPAHLVYRQSFLENGLLRAAGPFDDESGALWILEVETIEEAEKIVKGDPFVAADVSVSWKLRALSPVVVSPVKVPIKMSDPIQAKPYS